MMNSFVRGNIAFLKQARQLIDGLSDDLYRNNDLPPFMSGVGKHIRHVLDFYAALIHRRDDRINYDARGRDTTVETDRAAAVLRIDETCRALADLEAFDTPVWTKNDETVNIPADKGYKPSTLGRELQFLVNHTVHHFAMVALLLHAQGHETTKGFGVAISTLAYWHESGKGPAS